MTTYRGTYGDVVTGNFALPELSGWFQMRTMVDMTVDNVRRVSGNTVSAVISGSGTITFDAHVDYQQTTRTDTLVIAPTPITFSLSELDALLPEFGAEYGYFGTNNLFFRGNSNTYWRDGVELIAGETTLIISGGGDYRWTDGTLSLTGTYRSDGDLQMTTVLPWVRDNYTLNTEHGAATNGIVFEIERVDAALDAVTLDWWVTGDTYYDYTQVDFFGPRNPVLLDDFIGGVIPTGTVSFAAGQKRATVTVLLAEDAAAEHIELLQLNVTPDSSGLFNIRPSGSASVTDDDPAPVLKLAAVAAAVAEGNDGSTAVTFEVLRSANLAGSVTAFWGYDWISYSSIRTVDATDFADGIYPSGVLTLQDGQSRATFTVEIAADDMAEQDETFAIRLASQMIDPSDINRGQSVAEMVIRNDDAIADLAVAGADGTPRRATPAIYTGPVREIDKECILLGPEGLAVAARGPNWFIRTGSGDDAIALAGGRNVVDGGTGSNFIALGGGTDTVFVDIRAAAAPTWSTVVAMEPGDMATIWGLSSGSATMQWIDGWGAAGFTGTTLMATIPGAPTACLTLAGVGRAEFDAGRILTASGYDWASQSVYTNIWLRW